jgi:PAS domain S-box-containing protein
VSNSSIFSSWPDVLERVSDAIVAFDAEWRYTYINPQAAQICGKSIEELLGQVAWEVFPEAVGLPSYNAHMKAFSSQTVVITEFYYEPWNRWFENRIYPSSNGVTTYFQDITDRVLTLKALQESEERRILAISGSKDAIWDWNVVTNQVVLSARWSEMRGFAAVETTCDATTWSEGIHPEDFERVMQLVQSHFAKATELFRAEYRVRCADGSYMWISDRGQALWDETGQVVRMAGSETDITARKQAEADIRQLNAELEARVEQRTAELAIANQELTQANADLESFAYSVSHDLRSPLRAINGFANIFEEDYGTGLDSTAIEHLHIIQQQAKHMGALIDGLLQFSRLGRQPLHKQTVNCNALIAKVWQDLGLERGDRQIQFTVDELPPCQADPILLQQVWMNLLSNAVKYTAKVESAQIEIGVQNAPERVYFIRDNGAGFDLQYSDKLFGVFQRLHRSSEFPGTGVGLALTKRIIQRHGGQIWAEAAVDRGATFFFTIGD